MCHLWGEQRCSPFFMPAEKRENCDASVCTRVFLRARERPPFVDKSCVLPSPPPRQKTFFRACLVSGDRPVTSGKTSGCLQKRSVSSPSGCVVYQTGSEGLRDVIGDVCLLPVPGPSPKSSAISFRVVTLTRLMPGNKKGRGNSPAALVSGDGLRPSQAHSRP